MATNYTSLLGFALPTTGELAGTWGTVVNDNITELVEDSIAATATASVASGDWTLTTTGSGAANEARCAILIPTGSPGVSRNIIAPAQSKAYVVINQSNAAVVVKGSATTGTTIGAGDKAVVAWSGSDFVTVASTATDGVSTISFGTTGLTPSTATSGAVSVAGTLVASNGGTGQSSYTTGDILYASSSTALAKLADVATGNALISGGVGVAPAWGKVGLTTHVDGTLAVGNGGTGATTLTGVLKGNGTSAFTASNVNLASEVTGTLPVANGGTGQTSYTNGQLLIGNTTGNTLTKATLTAGSGISITNGTGSITIAATGGGGTVTSVSGTGTVNGITLTGTVTTTGSLTLGGSLSGVSLTSQVSGTLPVGNGGTGATTLTTNNVILGNGTSAVQFVAPGTNGNVLTSNGTTWTSAAGISLSGNNAFTGANTFYNATGQTFSTATSTNDGIILAGRAGGLNSYRVTLQPTTLSASRTLTLPDNTGTILTTGAAVTVAQGGTGLTTLTANNVILGNGTSTPTFVAPGTNGNVLTSNGTTWTSAAPAGGGSWVFLGSASGPGGIGTASLDFTSKITSTYDVYAFVFSKLVPQGSNTILQFQTSTNNGSSYDTSGYQWQITTYVGSTPTGYESANGGGINMTPDGSNSGSWNNSAGYGASGVLYLFNPLAAERCFVSYTVSWYSSGSPGINTGVGGGFRDTAADVDAVRFISSSQNIVSGTVRMYGIKNS